MALQYDRRENPLSTPFNYWQRHHALYIALGTILALVVALYMLYRRWQLQSSQVDRSIKRTARDDMCLDVLKSLSITYAIRNYRFRGIKSRTEPLQIQFYDLKMHLHSGECVLDGATGSFESSRLTAIMGPSGAGKSSFLNALCGRASSYAKTTGAVFVNGSPCKMRSFVQVMGFVPQQDTVYETLTVREQIEFSAALRNPKGTSNAKIASIVDDVLELLDLSHIQTHIVGSAERRGISGGEMKRVNIGLELAACPTILFLDEPTSGLDATNAHMIVNALKNFSQIGATVVTVIHQPRYSIFSLFDDVFFLAKGGLTAYSGTVNGVQRYFEHLGFERPQFENPADFYMDVISGEVPNHHFHTSDVKMFPKMWGEYKQNLVAQGQVECNRECTVGDIEHLGGILLEEGSRSVKDDSSPSLEQSWDDADTDGDGILQVEELRRLLRRRSGREPDEEALQELMEALDANANGVCKEKFIHLVCGLPDLLTPSQGDHPGRIKPVPAPGMESSKSPSAIGVNSPSQHRQDPGSIDFELVTPGFWMQYGLLLKKSIVLNFRRSRRMIVEICQISVFGAISGFLHRKKAQAAADVMIFQMCIVILVAVSCLRTFQDDRLAFNRDAAGGINLYAYFWAKVHINTVYLVFQCVVYVAFYYLVRGPAEPSQIYLVPCLLISAVASGWAYFVSVAMPSSNTTLAVCVIVVGVTAILGNPLYIPDFMIGGVAEIIVAASITRWSIQMFFCEWERIMPSDHYHAFREHEILDAYKTSKLYSFHSSALVLIIMAVCLRQISFLVLWPQGERCRRWVQRHLKRKIYRQLRKCRKNCPRCLMKCG